ncbi:hypothetical protein ACGFIW_01640 [Micromonospora sp. NPDC048935]
MDRIEAKTREIMAMDPKISPTRAKIQAMKVVGDDQRAEYHRQVMDAN